MELATTEEEAVSAYQSAGPDPADTGEFPIENPSIAPVPNDPLLEPHPSEPGVRADGTASPLENPDDSLSADPLAGIV